MFTIMRSRTMPALHTTVSRPPNVSIAWRIMAPAASQSLTSSPLTIASPPASFDLLHHLDCGRVRDQYLRR